MRNSFPSCGEKLLFCNFAQGPFLYYVRVFLAFSRSPTPVRNGKYGVVPCPCTQPYHVINLNTLTWHDSVGSMFEINFQTGKYFFRWKLNFQIPKFDLRFQLDSNGFSKDRSFVHNSGLKSESSEWVNFIEKLDLSNALNANWSRWRISNWSNNAENSNVTFRLWKIKNRIIEVTCEII